MPFFTPFSWLFIRRTLLDGRISAGLEGVRPSNGELGRWLLYRAYSLTWHASMLIYTNKRKCLLKKRVQFPQGCLGTPTWSPFHCFGTPIWPLWRHVNTLYLEISIAGSDTFSFFCNKEIDFSLLPVRAQGCKLRKFYRMSAGKNYFSAHLLTHEYLSVLFFYGLYRVTEFEIFHCDFQFAWPKLWLLLSKWFSKPYIIIVCCYKACLFYCLFRLSLRFLGISYIYAL